MGKVREAVDFLRVPEPHGEGATAWFNEDVKPLPPNRRTWTQWTYISWWSIWMLALSNFQLGAALVATGLAVWQSVLVIIAGRILTSMIAVLNGYPGATWHIGFPVFARSVWGIYGAYLPIVLRILLGLVGFAVQSWLGGLCVTVILSAMASSFANMRNTLPASAMVTTSQLTGWFVFLVVAIPIIYVRPEHSKRIMLIMNMCSGTTLVAITIWSLAAAGGGGPLLSSPGMPMGPGPAIPLAWRVLGGINSVIGTVAPALMSQPDFSRFARRPRDQVFGQAFAFIFMGTLIPLLGCLTASATMKIYGEPMWNPPILLATWLQQSYSSGTRAAAFFAAFGLAIAQMATTVVDNAYSLGMDLSGVFPRFINIRRGSYIGLALSMAFVPWYLLSTASIFLTVINSFTLFFGPICGVQIADYWLVRHRKIKLSDLYHAGPHGLHYYTSGFNWRSYVSWVVGFTPFLPGMIKAIDPTVVLRSDVALLYNMAFYLGFAFSFLTYLGLCRLVPVQGAGEYDPVDYYGTFTEEEAKVLGVEIAGASSPDQYSQVNVEVGEKVRV